MNNASTLRLLFRQAVLDALTARHRVGIVLSGGIDSSSVACVARALGRDIPCFTGYFHGDQYDERKWARLAAHLEHHEILITPDDFVENFDACAQACEPPFQGIGTFGQYMVAKYVAQAGITTVLSGEGSDELFGGYARQMIVAGVERPDGYENYKLPDGYPKSLKKALAYDYERLPLLLAVDAQMCGAHGVTSLAPFTDPKLVEWALKLPPALRVNKVVLKEAMSGVVPNQILERTDKRGFPAPLVEWAQREPVASFIFDRIGYQPDPGKLWDRGWFHDMLRASRHLAMA